MMLTLLRTIAPCVCVLLAQSTPPACAGALPYDLNGDGRQELVVGLPDFDNPAADSAARSVAVLEGSSATLVGSPRVINQDSLGVPDDEQGVFGEGVASGDFDADGYADLAVAVPLGGPRPADGSSTSGRSGTLPVVSSMSRTRSASDSRVR